MPSATFILTPSLYSLSPSLLYSKKRWKATISSGSFSRAVRRESSRGAHSYCGGKNGYRRGGKVGQQFPSFTSPIAATQQHPQTLNIAHRAERGDAQNPPAHVMPHYFNWWWMHLGKELSICCKVSHIFQTCLCRGEGYFHLLTQTFKQRMLHPEWKSVKKLRFWLQENNFEDD